MAYLRIVPRRQEVDAWFARYNNPMKDVVQRVREIILAADARIDECIKWQAPTFTYKGNLASFYPKAKQHASLMFHTGALLPGKHPRLEGTGGTSRVLKLASMDEANAARLDIERIVAAWIESRDASGKPVKSATKAKPATRPKPATRMQPARAKTAAPATPAQSRAARVPKRRTPAR